MLIAIARNPKAFAARIAANLRQAVDLFIQGKLISFELSLLLIGLLLGWLLLRPSFRLLAYFAMGLCSVTGIFLVFHIDDRYLTIAASAAILLGSLSAHGLNRLPMPSRFGENAFASILLAVALLHLAMTLALLPDALQRERLDLSAFRQIGEGPKRCPRASGRIAANHRTTGYSTAGHAESQPGFALIPLLCAQEPLASRLQCGLPARSAILDAAMSADARDRSGSASQGGFDAGQVFRPQVGQLAVIRLTDSHRAGSSLGRFCTAKVAH